MAKTSWTLPTEIEKQIDDLAGKLPNICDVVTDAGAKVAEDAIAQSLKQTVKNKESTLVDSIATQKVSETYKLITFEGERDRNGKKVRNNEIAAYLEYGTHDKKNLPATHFLSGAMKRRKKDITNAMEKTFDDELKKIT